MMDLLTQKCVGRFENSSFFLPLIAYCFQTAPAIAAVCVLCLFGRF